MLSFSRWKKTNYFLSKGIVLSQLQIEIYFRSSTTKLPTDNYPTFLVNSLGVTRTFISRAIKDTSLTFNNHPRLLSPRVLRTHTNVRRALPEVRLIEESDFIRDLPRYDGKARETVRSRVRRKLLRNPYFSPFLTVRQKQIYVLFVTKYEASKRSIMKVNKVHRIKS